MENIIYFYFKLDITKYFTPFDNFNGEYKQCSLTLATWKFIKDTSHSKPPQNYYHVYEAQRRHFQHRYQTQLE